MPPSPTIHGTFTISSGCLCFGHLAEIWSGASVPVQPLQQPRLRQRDTVAVQPMEYNTAALNGTWNVYRLVTDQPREDTLVGWFAAHADVDPQQEADKILRVSGSPYEKGSGSQWNNAQTFAEGVFVINRYDWLHNRGVEEMNDEIEEIIHPRAKRAKTGHGPEPDSTNIYTKIKTPWGATAWRLERKEIPRDKSIWLVDHKEARETVLKYHKQAPQDDWPRGVAYLSSKDAEYQFARFGYDDVKKAARSFIIFPPSTFFPETGFEGIETTLRMFEADEERFCRLIEEGTDFPGIETLKFRTDPNAGIDSNADSAFPGHAPGPPSVQLLGPDDKKMHILTCEDIDALRNYAKNGDGRFPRRQTLREPVTKLAVQVFGPINEMLMSHLERRVFPNIFDRTPAEAEEVLFPRQGDTEQRSHLDGHCLMLFRKAPTDRPFPGFDSGVVGNRIRAFLLHLRRLHDYQETGLFRRSRRLVHRYEPSVDIDPQTLIGLTAVVAYLATEMLKLANMVARDNRRTPATPLDLRATTLYEAQLCDTIEYAEAFGYGW